MFATPSTADLPPARRLTRRMLASVMTALAAVVLSLVAVPSAAASTDAEATFVSKINAERTARGLAPLAVAADLTAVARKQSAAMASSNSLFHNASLATDVTNWRSLAENVGYGGSVDQVHDALMNSSGHRANILGGFKELGIGVVISGGRVWVTQVFRDPVPGTTTSAVPPADGYRAPFGSLDGVSRVPGGVQVSGWTIDPDTTGAVAVHVYVDGRYAGAVSASSSRPDVGAAYPAYGSNRGYATTIPVNAGSREVCAYALDAERRVANPLLGCRRVSVSSAPFGSVDGVRRVPGGLAVSGWAIDPDTTSPIAAHLYVDGRYAGNSVASASRPDVGRVFPAWGGDHGYAFQIPVTGGGSRQLCGFGIDDKGGFNPLLACRSVLVEDRPIGSLDAATVTRDGVRMSGWALDPDTAASIDVHVYVGPRGTAARAAGTRSDVAAVYSGYGAAHGFDVVAPVPGRGTWQACAYGINTGTGVNSLLGCRTVTV